MVRGKRLGLDIRVDRRGSLHFYRILLSLYCSVATGLLTCIVGTSGRTLRSMPIRPAKESRAVRWAMEMCSGEYAPTLLT